MRQGAALRVGRRGLADGSKGQSRAWHVGSAPGSEAANPDNIRDFAACPLSPPTTLPFLPPSHPSAHPCAHPSVPQELVLKDHALEPDSEALRRSAHLMVTGLAQVGQRGGRAGGAVIAVPAPL